MSNKDDFDTTYRKVKGFHIIGYDANDEDHVSDGEDDEWIN